jgi:uncharacterized phage protein gp47/JayE
MTTNRPVLYKRDASELRKQIEQDLHDTIQWQGQKDGAGQGMVQLFGRLAEIIIDRLNRAPEQHFLAFLNEGGIDQLPPQAASTKMAFLAEEDGRPAIQVPAGTQVATRATGGKPEVIFETEHDIQVIPTELVRCIAVDQRTYTDRTDQANKQAPGSFAAFQGDAVRERVLYLGQDTLLDLPDPAVRARTVVTLLVEVEPTVGTVPDAWDLVWLYWDGKEWSSLAASGATIQDSTANLSRSGEVTVTALPELGKTKVNDAEGVWIACQLIPQGEQSKLPTIRRIRIAREIVVPEQQVTIDAAFTGTQAGAAFAPLNPSDSFYPFGQRPELLDGFYLQADEALLKPGATVELRMDVQGLPAEPGDISELEKVAVDWEYFSAQGWTRLGTSRWGCPALEFLDRDDLLIKDVHLVARGSESYFLEIDLPDDFAGNTPPPSLPGSTLRYHPWTAKPYAEMKLPPGCELLPTPIVERGRGYRRERLNFRDTTCAFTAGGSGLISFTVPAATGSDPLFASTEMNGQTGYWIRARIVDGSYSVPRPKPGGLVSKLLIGELPTLPSEPLPPLAHVLTVHYRNYHTVDPSSPLQRCWSKTDQRWTSHEDSQPFAPFTSSVEHRALYLGFNPLDPDPLKAGVAFPPNTWIDLYLDVEETGDESTPSRVLWEYWNGAQWQELATVDETHGLWRQGTLGFYGPPDHRPGVEFGERAYWLRVSPQEVTGQGSLTQPAGEPAVAWMPRLNAIRLNTVDAINAETAVDEVLGSSNGEENQAFKLARSPVLSDLQIEVREPGEQLNQPGETWVRWDRVSSFNACGPNSRCFVLDAVTGTVFFGNGLRGMIPPAGQNNIGAKRYRTHADAAGNLAANTITVVRNPKDALNEIRLVANFEPASGGSGPEETAAVMLRAPYSLKNRQRAVAKEDFEWLAREVEGARRVFCLPTRQRDGSTRAGWVTVVVVPTPASAGPESADRHLPSPELLRQVRAHLEQRGLTNLAGPEVSPRAGQSPAFTPDQDQIHVARPGFVEVKVSAHVMPKDVTKADNTRNDILQQLREFLDPLAGGPDREGWEPGRDVYVSEVAAEIERVPGVDHVDTDTISLYTPTRQQQLLQIGADVIPDCDIPAGSQVSTLDERIKLILGASLPKANPLQRLNVYGLNVGEPVLLTGSDGAVQADTRLASQLVDLFEIKFDQPIEFASTADFAKWLEDLGDAPGLASTDGRFWLPLPSMGQNAQFDTKEEPTGMVTLWGVTATGLKAGDGLSVGDKVGIVGAVGSRPLDARHVSQWLDNLFWIVFDLPVDFENKDAFEEWQGRLGEFASLSRSDRRIRLPITSYDRHVDATGRLHLTGVIAQGIAAEELVSLTHAGYRHRRVDFLPVQQVSPWVDQQRVFVPADHMVCSGSHEITMIVEAAHAS